MQLHSVMSVDNKKVIVGLGKTGFSCARYLAAKGESFTIVDTRKNPPYLAALNQELPEQKVELGGFKESTILAASELILSPGLSLKIPVLQKAIAQGTTISSDIDIFSREAKSPIVAVTGSNGKSTVVTLVAEMARQAGVKVAVGGNLDCSYLDDVGDGSEGLSALDLLQFKDIDLYVLEVSSFQLELTHKLAAEVATVLNVSADHMDRYDSMDDYVEAKHRIFRGCKQILINRDDLLSSPATNLSLQRNDTKTWYFGLNNSEFSDFGLLSDSGEQFLAFQFKKIISIQDLKIAGKHNIANALAALALGTAVGLPMKSMSETLKTFSGLPHRCQWVRNVSGVDIYNDSKGTNVGAAVSAIEGLGESAKGHIILIAGGESKDADFSQLRQAMCRWGRVIVLLGRDAKRIAASLGEDFELVFAEDMQDAVHKSMQHAQIGDVILLSPACASFDMFTNYQQRGSEFIDAVKALPEAWPGELSGELPGELPGELH